MLLNNDKNKKSQQKKVKLLLDNFTLKQHLTELVIKRINHECGKTVNIINITNEDHNDPSIKSKDLRENS